MQKELQEYISKNLALGFSLEQIKSKLLSSGWPEDKVTEAMSIFSKQLSEAPPYKPLPFDSLKKFDRRKLIKITIFITIGLIALSLILLLFSFVQKEETTSPTNRSNSSFSSVNSSSNQNRPISTSSAGQNSTTIPLPNQTTQSQSNHTNSTNNSNSSKDYSKIIDCGTDFECFEELAEDCHLSRVEVTGSQDMAGILTTAIVALEIFNESSDCVISTRVLSVNLTFSEDLKQQLLEDNSETPESIALIESQESLSVKQRFEGKEGRCTTDSESQLISIIEKMRTLSVTQADLADLNCQGTLVI